MQESIVETLKNMKSEQNLTLQQISSASGVPLSTVNRILSGQTENPSFRDVAAIVATMDGSLDAITGLQKLESENGQLLDSNVMQLLLSMQNYYAKTLDAARQQYMRELENKDKQYRVASNIKPFQAADRIGQVLGSVVFRLPYSQELEEQYLAGELLADLSMKDSRAFRKEIDRICEEVF